LNADSLAFPATAFGGFGLDRRRLGVSSFHQEMYGGLSLDFGVARRRPWIGKLSF